jgi:ATP-dependent Clp protease ATP-binding subunit ClpX
MAKKPTDNTEDPKVNRKTRKKKSDNTNQSDTNNTEKKKTKKSKHIEDYINIYKPTLRECSFCGRSEKMVDMMYTSELDGANVCVDCANVMVEQAYAYMQEQVETETRNKILEQIPTPNEIKSYLDEYVIGQDDAKITLSIAAYNHMKRIIQKNDEVEIEKSNICLIGNTGCGKSLLAKALAKVMNVPYAIVDATTFTEAGYVGEDAESMLSRLLAAADYDVEKAERGIIVIDEGDKLARKGENTSITRDVSGEGVQQAILKLVEGSKVNVPPYGGRKHPEKPVIEMDTTNILFIFMGAFEGLAKKVEKRLKSATVGFKTNSDDNFEYDKDNILKYATHQDLRTFGIIPELIGRLPVLTYVSPLDKNALIKILTEPKNAIIKQYKKLLDMDGVTLEFKPEALDVIAEHALNCELGARGLRAITEAVVKDCMYTMPALKKKNPKNNKYVITAEYAKEQIEKTTNILKKQA